MKISKLIEELERQKEVIGDCEVMMQATTMRNDGGQIFDSTVETTLAREYKGKQVLKLYWQCH
jgi:hypothetical protein